MKTPTSVSGVSEIAPAAPRRGAGRYFYTVAGLGIVSIVLIGFSRTYYLRPAFTSDSLSGLLHLHGLIMSLWFAVFVTQTWLVAKRHVQTHRQLGWFAAFVGVAVLVVGCTVAIATAKIGRAPPGVPPLAFLTIPLGDMVGFASLLGLGLYWRTKPDLHKRLLLLCSLSILPAAIARFPFEWVAKAGPLAYFGLADLCIVLCAAYDTWLRRRVHPVWVIGGVYVVGLQVFRLWLSGTATWNAIATWLVS